MISKKLSHDECEIMKTHVTIGAEILSGESSPHYESGPYEALTLGNARGPFLTPAYRIK